MTNTTTPAETQHSSPLCPKCKTPLVRLSDTAEPECLACEEIERMKSHAGCPHCGANSYYKDGKLEGYKCRSCKGEFSEKELTAWIEDLDKVVESCREDPRWSLHSLMAHPPPFYLHEIAKNRMDFLAGKKTITQISNPAHCRDNLIKHYPHAPNVFGDLTLERASEILSKALVFAYTGQRESVIFRRQGKSFYISVKGKGFLDLKCRTGFYCMQILLQNPNTEIEAPTVEKFCEDPNIQRWTQDSTLVLNTGGIKGDFHYDRTTERQIWKELERLEGEIEAATDPEQTAQLREEHTEGTKYLTAGTDQYHKRREFSKEDMKARQRVRRNIGTALEFLRDSGAEELIDLAAQLNRDIHKGKFFSYSPDQNNPIHWVLS